MLGGFVTRISPQRKNGNDTKYTVVEVSVFTTSLELNIAKIMRIINVFAYGCNIPLTCLFFNNTTSKIILLNISYLRASYSL